MANKEAGSEKEKSTCNSSGAGNAPTTIENRAVDKYYSDEEWAKRVEEEMRTVAGGSNSSGSSNGGGGRGWLSGLTGGKGKGKSGVRKGEIVQGAPWIESR